MENWEILEMLVKRSGMCRIGGLGGCVLGAQRRKRNREGEGGQERLLAGELSEAAVSMCAGRVQRGEPPPHRTPPSPALPPPGCTQKGPLRAPPAPKCCMNRGQSPSSSPQRETGLCSVTSGVPWTMPGECRGKW